MAGKGLNIETMEKEILNNPEVYNTTFIASSTNPFSDSMNRVKQFIGKHKIKGLQMMTGKAVLVTMNNVDDMNDLLASVTSISYNVQGIYFSDNGLNNYCTLAFTPVLPVPARVRIKISGIPLPLASGNLKDIKEHFIEVAKELKEVELSLEKEDGIETGNLIVDAMTDDLKVTHGKLKSNAGIKYQDFNATVKFIKSFPVRKESMGKFNAPSGITVISWK